MQIITNIFGILFELPKVKKNEYGFSYSYNRQ